MRDRCFWPIFLGLALVTARASADWQYTKWGMTPEEVVAASNGLATEVSPEEKGKGGGALNDLENTEVLLKAPHEAGRYKFTASFCFDKVGHRLSAVQLILDKERLSPLGVELLASLGQKYGTPVTKKESLLLQRIEWRAENETVIYIRLGSADSPLGILVEYAPIKTKENEKL